MIEILSNKNLTSRFQILVEIASSQPNVQQKDIALNLGITPQAVSDYIQQLTADGLVLNEGRSRHRVSQKGIDWMIHQLNDVKEYFISVERIIWNIRTTAALADNPIKNGQTVGLLMKEGLLYASGDISGGSTGLAVTDAVKGDIVGVTDIRGIIKMETGEVTIIEIPGIQKGKNRRVNLAQVNQIINGRRPVAYLGLESMAVLNSLSITPDILYAGSDAVIEAVRRGISPVLICVDEQLSVLTKHLDENAVAYQVFSAR
jgi:putative transcriptional regulator